MAGPDDVGAICQFGDAHIRPHYTPLIGAAAAAEQVRKWWNEEYVGHTVAQGLVLVAESDGQLVGVAQRGWRGDDPVLYKLYLHPDHRGAGLGPRLVAALIGQLPENTDRFYVEHPIANQRAGAFYEREGFRMDWIEPSSSGEPRRNVVWRVRQLEPHAG